MGKKRVKEKGKGKGKETGDNYQTIVSKKKKKKKKRGGNKLGELNDRYY